MKWFKRIIVGNYHHEYRNEDGEKYNYLFTLVKYSSGKIMLHDLRHMPSKNYIFTSVREAKKIAIQSITDKSVLKPYYDYEADILNLRFRNVMKESKALLAKYKLDEKEKKSIIG